MTVAPVQILPVPGLPVVHPGDDLAGLIAAALESSGVGLQAGDVLVVTQKIVSKAEGRVVDLRTVEPSPRSLEIAAQTEREPAHVEVILREAVRLVRVTRPALIVETRLGLVCANAGVDRSNTDPDTAVLLPLDPDASAARLRESLRTRFGVAPAVVISDTFGRPWRLGQTNVAIGVAGMSPFRDYRGETDAFGRPLQVSRLAVADELAGAAELVMNKYDQIPVAVVRGYAYPPGDGRAADIARPPAEDLFR